MQVVTKPGCTCFYNLCFPCISIFPNQIYKILHPIYIQHYTNCQASTIKGTTCSYRSSIPMAIKTTTMSTLASQPMKAPPCPYCSMSFIPWPSEWQEAYILNHQSIAVHKITSRYLTPHNIHKLKEKYRWGSLNFEGINYDFLDN